MSLRGRYQCVLLVLIASASAPASAGADPDPTPDPASVHLQSGAWRAVQPGDTLASARQTARQGAFTRFDPSRMSVIPAGSLGAWVMLYPAAAGSAGPRVLSIINPPGGRITFYDTNGKATTSAINDPGPALRAHGRVAFALPPDMAPTAAIVLRYQPAGTLDTPAIFRLQSRAQFRADDTRWLVLASASLAVMLSMSLVALCFSSMLRDATFAWYAVYVSAFAGMQAVQTGFLVQVLGLASLAPGWRPMQVAFIGISSLGAVMFVTRFCDLGRHAPWLRTLLASMIGVLAAVTLLHLVNVPSVHALVNNLFYPLLALCAGLMIVAGSVALLRGSRYALYLLFGWLPLLVVTALTGAQVKGALPGVDWLGDASLACGALQAIVLAVGLADRSLYLRRDHHLARQLADKDPLTGVLNRRGWFDAVLKLMTPERRHSVLFMDLDHFKSLNDRLGHASGDHALQRVAQSLLTELRPQDLLCRFGGEEFVALLTDIGQESARQVAQRLCRRMHRMDIPLNRDGDGEILTISIGVATRRGGEEITGLIDRADAAMYAAKSRGRNRVVADSELSPTLGAERPAEGASAPAGS